MDMGRRWLNTMHVDAMLKIKNTFVRAFTPVLFSSGAADDSYHRRAAGDLVLNFRTDRRVHGEDAIPIVARVFAWCGHIWRNNGLGRRPDCDARQPGQQ